ncbi:hypothetical protein F7725_004604 [Dissostichus mawsoni]|uniref:Ubiquitin carboxyl-terminal hydrolase n=1 Tax=Dissostichus mawsoni TaxID=36200 RepID=A0A7J5XJI8_DISMA|nr:hypothetical protein F7725_004604 [Dissostichus mawsoni]
MEGKFDSKKTVHLHERIPAEEISKTHSGDEKRSERRNIIETGEGTSHARASSSVEYDRAHSESLSGPKTDAKVTLPEKVSKLNLNDLPSPKPQGTKGMSVPQEQAVGIKHAKKIKGVKKIKLRRSASPLKQKGSKKRNILLAIKYHGLVNQGSTCYLNSVLQVLFMTKDFREAVERFPSEKTEHIDLQLQSLFGDLKRRSAKTKDITRRASKTDAAEYYEKILRLTIDDASKIFHGQLTHMTAVHPVIPRLALMGLFGISLLHWRVPPVRTIAWHWGVFRASHFNGENQMYCDECRAWSDATTKCVIKHHPGVLTLLLKRFQLDHYSKRYVKINCTVDVPCTLQIPENQPYELYAMVEHTGDLRGGHYIATIKSEHDGRCYSFNDSCVTELHSQPFQSDIFEKSSSAYLLFYRKEKVYEQQDAAEYFEKILAKTSDDASKVNGIEKYFRESSLNGENRMYCEKCDDKSDATTIAVDQHTQHPEVHYLSPSKGATRAQTDTAMGKIYQVVVHGFKGVGALRLIFTDKILDGEADLLSEYGIQNQSHIHMVLKIQQCLSSVLQKKEGKDATANAFIDRDKGTGIKDKERGKSRKSGLSPDISNVESNEEDMRGHAGIRTSRHTSPEESVSNMRSPPAIKYHGLVNQGSTCYLNSVLQVLFMTKDFREANQTYELYAMVEHTGDLRGGHYIATIKSEHDGRWHSFNDSCVTESAAHHSQMERYNSGKIYQVSVVGLRGDRVFIDIANTEQQFRSMTVKQLKEKMALKFPEIEGGNMRLMFTDKDLDEDSKLLSAYGVVDKSVIFMTLRNQPYELYAMVEHFGDLRGGHYIATIKSEHDGRWHSFNDSCVTEIQQRLSSVLQKRERFPSEKTEHIDLQLQSLCSAKTKDITKKLGIQYVYRQQDAAEYYEKILRLTNIPRTADTHDHMFILQNYSVEKGIEEFFRASHFNGENQMYCDECRAKSDATTKCVIKHHPEVLTAAEEV